MLKQILQSMVQSSADLPSEAANPRAVWMNEWARLMLDAYEPGKTVVYTSCYAFPGELLAAFKRLAVDRAGPKIKQCFSKFLCR